ncbi:twin-arginine translocation signal domain-containing protein [Nitrincola nitratireducens]|uniref:Formate dehydrogenase region TAT target n=1 Tax=Nitrincola nitratireducens TaxID=1229521 RepID=W9US07_9GAMM|nr:twin-arginine translocation signal domain-containing protein [Nitrincola nitratireducens]EXJ09854.1 formate dehydrogenase region TAT target [Nitrincola nitratireducens]
MHNKKQPVNEKASVGRRQFLKGMAVVSAAGVAVTAGQAVASTDVPDMAPAADTQGYHETDHIRAYYASCR